MTDIHLTPNAYSAVDYARSAANTQRQVSE